MFLSIWIESCFVFKVGGRFVGVGVKLIVGASLFHKVEPSKEMSCKDTTCVGFFFMCEGALLPPPPPPTPRSELDTFWSTSKEFEPIQLKQTSDAITHP